VKYAFTNSGQRMAKPNDDGACFIEEARFSAEKGNHISERHGETWSSQDLPSSTVANRAVSVFEPTGSTSRFV